ncbi:magnesium/cobalt transporter CorA [Mesorhizobium sp. SB112]|uniref:magnesium/cobalt transporter CorA n=1 Tax=Mesorhizobium sp. SB112 TaxID=3151853 RepID=UPI0032649021
MKADGEMKRRHAKRSPVGASPGTLLADPHALPSTLNLTLISPEKCEFIDGATLKDVKKHQGHWPVIWLDCVGLQSVDLIAEIGELFKLHPLALEDTVNTGQRPKVDFFENHAFVVLSMIDDMKLSRYEQISVFFGENFVVSFQERPGDPFDPVRKRIKSSSPNRLRSRKADYLAYALIDSVVDSYFPVLEGAGDKIDHTEDDMVRSVRKEQVRQLHELRRGMSVLKRALWPLRDAVAGLIRAETPILGAETRVYLNDTQDHLIRLIEIVETHRDMLTSLIDMHISLSQARINEIIRFLTIMSSIFIPLTFLAGIWGMNFDPVASPWNMPELLSYYGYPIALGSMVLVAVGLIIFFRWKKWL